MGHILSTNCDDEHDKMSYWCLTYWSNDHWTISCVMLEMLPVNAKIRLVKEYCTRFHGSELWDLSNKGVNDICIVWRRGIRQLCMCNASMRDGNLPISQKAAIIPPIVKKRGLDVDDVKSYRPISNLTFISKVIERIVATQMQSAYRAGHSIETATLKVLSDILDAVDSQETMLLGLLDMSAAFDTVDFDILLRQLEISYWLSGHVLKWLTSFVTDRTQAIVFDDTTSSPVKLDVSSGKVQYWVRCCSYCMPPTFDHCTASWCTNSRIWHMSAVRLSIRTQWSARFRRV